MPDVPMPREEPDAGSWAGEPFHEDAGLDWEALRAGGRLHVFCYLRDTVLALALLVDAAS